MELIKDYYESSAYTFFKNKSIKVIEKLIEDYGCDEDLINTFLLKNYPEDKFFILVDYIDENNGSFHIRIWKK